MKRVRIKFKQFVISVLIILFYMLQYLMIQADGVKDWISGCTTLLSFMHNSQAHCRTALHIKCRLLELHMTPFVTATVGIKRAYQACWGACAVA